MKRAREETAAVNLLEWLPPELILMVVERLPALPDRMALTCVSRGLWRLSAQWADWFVCRDEHSVHHRLELALRARKGRQLATIFVKSPLFCLRNFSQHKAAVSTVQTLDLGAYCLASLVEGQPLMLFPKLKSLRVQIGDYGGLSLGLMLFGCSSIKLSMPAALERVEVSVPGWFTNEYTPYLSHSRLVELDLTVKCREIDLLNLQHLTQLRKLRCRHRVSNLAGLRPLTQLHELDLPVQADDGQNWFLDDEPFIDGPVTAEMIAKAAAYFPCLVRITMRACFRALGGEELSHFNTRRFIWDRVRGNFEATSHYVTYIATESDG